MRRHRDSRRLMAYIHLSLFPTALLFDPLSPPPPPDSQVHRRGRHHHFSFGFASSLCFSFSQTGAHVELSCYSSSCWSFLCSLSNLQYDGIGGRERGLIAGKSRKI